MISTPSVSKTLDEDFAKGMTEYVDQKIKEACDLLVTKFAQIPRSTRTARHRSNPSHKTSQDMIVAIFDSLRASFIQEIDRRLLGFRVQASSSAQTERPAVGKRHPVGSEQDSRGSSPPLELSISPENTSLSSRIASPRPQRPDSAQPMARSPSQELVQQDAPSVRRDRTELNEAQSPGGCASTGSQINDVQSAAGVGSIAPEEAVSACQGRLTEAAFSDRIPGSPTRTRQSTRSDGCGPVTGVYSVEQSLQSTSVSGTLKLDADGLGDRLIHNLEAHIIAHPESSRKVSIELNTDWERIVKRTRPPKDHDYFAVCHAATSPRQDGVSHLYRSQSKEFRPQDLSVGVEVPSKEEAEAYYDQMISNPPPGDIPYYVGPLPKSELDTLFPPGKLSELGLIPGSTTLYQHSGDKGSGTPFHCEDARWRSYNLTLFGYKLWILIRQHHTAKFEAFLRQSGSSGQCDQFGRHKMFLVSLERLQKEEIEYDTVLAGPGDLVETRPKQYHAVLNVTESVAIATNFVLPEEELIPHGLLVCPEDGLYLLEHPHLTKLPTETPAPRRTTKRKVPPIVQFQPSGSKRSRTTGASDVCNPVTLATQLSDKATFSHLCSLIIGWRNRTEPLFRISQSESTDVQLVNIIEALEISTSIREFLSRFARAELAKSIDSETATKQRNQRGSSSQVSNVLTKLGWGGNDRKKLHNYLTQGRKWNTLCRDMPGLLCLIPPNRRDSSCPHRETGLFLRLANEGAEAIKEFHDCFLATKFGKPLLRMAKIFQEALWLQKDVPLFRWEDWDLKALGRLSMTKLGPLMETFEVLTANFYDPDTVDWPKPDFWRDKATGALIRTTIQQRGSRLELQWAMGSRTRSVRKLKPQID